MRCLLECGFVVSDCYGCFICYCISSLCIMVFLNDVDVFFDVVVEGVEVCDNYCEVWVRMDGWLIWCRLVGKMLFVCRVWLKFCWGLISWFWKRYYLCIIVIFLNMRMWVWWGSLWLYNRILFVWYWVLLRVYVFLWCFIRCWCCFVEMYYGVCLDLNGEYFVKLWVCWSGCLVVW